MEIISGVLQIMFSLFYKAPVCTIKHLIVFFGDMYLNILCFLLILFHIYLPCFVHILLHTKSYTIFCTLFSMSN
jgi:hypothetical protein